MADYGYRVRDETGAVKLKITDRITQIFGRMTTTTGNGSFTIPFTARKYWFGIVTFVAVNASSQPPSVTIAGNVISWTYPPGTIEGMKRPVTVMYGGY